MRYGARAGPAPLLLQASLSTGSSGAADGSEGSGGGSMPLARLASTLREMEAEPARLARTALMTELLQDAICNAPDELLPCVAVATMNLVPSNRPLKLGVGENLVVQALGDACARPADELKDELRREGDIGTLTERLLLQRQGPTSATTPASGEFPLSVREVHAVLIDVAAQEGKGSQQRKTELMSGLLRRATPIEGLLIVRAVRGQLRSGLGAKGMRDALAAAASAAADPPPECVAAEAAATLAAARATKAEEDAAVAAANGEVSTKREVDNLAKAARKAKREAAKLDKAAIKQRDESRRRAAALVSEAFSVNPCYHVLIGELLARGVWDLTASCRASAGTPVQPMAATAAVSIEAAMGRLLGAPFLCELKYDGERCQAHFLPATDGTSESRVLMFSRSLDEVSARFPEIVEAFPSALGEAVSSAIIDGELCAVDEETGAVLPFSELASRPRKAPTEAQLAAGPAVCLFAFDLLEVNGESLLSLPLAVRREKMQSLLAPVGKRIAFAEGTEATTAEELRNELDRAIDCQSEGLVVKALSSQDGEGTYEAGKKSLQWLKLKRDYIDGLGDSFDLVPLGAYRGRGKRADWFGAYLLGCYDQTRGVWQPVCKIGTGFSDEQLERWHTEFQAHAVEEDASVVDVGEGLPPNLTPHVWLAPAVVWEVSAAAVSVSPTYPASFGMVAEGKGLALRFPRLVRERDDKRPQQATTAFQLAEVYRTQPSLA